MPQTVWCLEVLLIGWDASVAPTGELALAPAVRREGGPEERGAFPCSCCRPVSLCSWKKRLPQSTLLWEAWSLTRAPCKRATM